MSARPSRGAFAWVPWALLGATLVLGLLAPIVANDVPLVARQGGRLWFPAFADLVGEPPPCPVDVSWKQWWARLDPEGDDWALMPPWPYGPIETDAARFDRGPSLAHPLGSDSTGRDVLARIVHGAGTAVVTAVPSVLLAGLVGTLLGAWAGLAGGVVDFLVLRLIELCLCFPAILFLLFAGAFFGSTLLGLTIVLAFVFWIGFARIVRGEMLSLREREFVMVARGLGVSTWRIVTRHMLPQVLGQIGVTAAFYVASAIVAESTLSFLGVGPDAVSWGEMLRRGSEQAAVGAWHLWLFPALAIVAVVVSCHVLADRVRGTRPSGVD